MLCQLQTDVSIGSRLQVHRQVHRQAQTFSEGSYEVKSATFPTLSIQNINLMYDSSPSQTLFTR
ncbi:hypothetical protein BgiBS90_035144, partial [Biomphalaria glabrata]